MEMVLNEYLFAEGKKLSVFSSDGKKLFDHSFADAITETPFICSFGPGINKIAHSTWESKQSLSVG